jgi:hypothetical protein
MNKLSEEKKIVGNEKKKRYCRKFKKKSTVGIEEKYCRFTKKNMAVDEKIFLETNKNIVGSRKKLSP